DIDFGELRQEPVLRQPRDADYKSDNRREYDADRRDEERVQQPDEEDPPVGRGVVVADQRLRNVEAGRLVEKPEAGRDIARGEIGASIGDKEPERDGDDDEQKALD